MNLHYYAFAFMLLVIIGRCSANWFSDLQTKPKLFIQEPALPQRPFLAVWNVETDACLSRYNVSIDLSAFDIVINPKQRRYGSNMVILYSGAVGLYPNFDDKGNPVNGGLPQSGNISAHYEKCVQDIEKLIPDKNYHGLAVIDWESWRPLWDHNAWGFALIYQTESKAKVKREHPEWTEAQILSEAKLQFEQAAKNYMLGTLNIAQLLRPHAAWGYYLFPDCYNYAKTGSDFTCHKNVILDNNKLEWLFSQSTALYPSIYVGLWFKNSSATALYAGNRVKEAQRVDANRKSAISIPVYVYTNLVYRRTREFLTKRDLIHSSGVAAMLGASGVVVWGQNMEDNKSCCKKLKQYVENTLGPYLKLASDSASICSLKLCRGHGRCVWNDYGLSKEDVPDVVGQFLELTLPQWFNQSVSCQCYPGFHGSSCQYFA